MARVRPSGWWYPWIFVAGMLVVVVVNAVMISFAIGTFPGLATEDAYRKGLAYNQTIDRAQAGDALGWRAELAYVADPSSDPGEARRGTLSVRLVDRDARPLDGLDVVVALVRPTHAGADVHATLEPRGGGLYVADVVPPLPGQWDARLRARDADRDFQETRRIVVP